MSTRVPIEVPDPAGVLTTYGAGALVRLERAAASDFSGAVEIVLIGVAAGVASYTYVDGGGTNSSWYRTRYSDALGTVFSAYGPGYQGKVAFVTAADVRGYLLQSTTDPGSNKQLSDAILNPFIETAEGFLALRTSRQFVAETAVTKSFRVRRRYIPIPDCRLITAMTYDGSPLVENVDFWTEEDPDHPGILIGIHLRRLWLQGVTMYGTPMAIPRLLAVTGDWGYDPYPSQLQTASKVMAAWLAKTPDAVLGGVLQVGDGQLLDISKLPAPVYYFINAWDRGTAVTN